MKILSRLIIFILLLPLMLFGGLYLYGSFMRTMIESKQDALEEGQEALSTTGNGVGGEQGMKVLVADHNPDRYFWMDNDRLIFVTAHKARMPLDAHRKFIWNVADNEIKPIQLDGGLICFDEGKLYHSRDIGSETSKGGKSRVARFESTLRELNDRWVVDNSRHLEEMWSTPSEQQRLFPDRDCNPWFELKPEFRNQKGVSEFRTKYLREWNWILRLPPIGYEFSLRGAPESEFGFFAIREKSYFGQQGQKVADLPDMTAYHLNKMKITYTPHLDSYLLTLPINSSMDVPYIAILNRDGGLAKIKWEDSWDGYNAHPLLSRKGLVWTGRDYRETKPSIHVAGSFVRLFENGIHKYVHGSGNDLVLSPNGCFVAQSNRPKTTSGQRNLIVFDVCNSTYGGTR